MSLSSPKLTNPAEHFFEWRNGTVQFYDKEQAKAITIPMPFTFIVLDELHTVTGYSDQDQSGIWANEARSTREDFTVRTKRGVKYVGPYKNDQGINQVAAFGGRYTKSIYIAHPNRAGDLILGHLKLTGAALTAWIDFSKQHSTTSGKISITGSTEGKKGATTYQIPTFAWSKWTDAEYQAAIVLDKMLQNYLGQYLTAPKYDDTAEPVVEDAYEDTRATPEQIADFEARKARKFDLSPDPMDKVFSNGEPLPEFPGSDPINLDEIPF